MPKDGWFGTTDSKAIGVRPQGGEYLSEHAVHFWRGSRDTVVERNRILNSARGIGFGLDNQGRTYSDDPCPDFSSAGHFGGVIRNNFISASDSRLFASGNGFDTGIALWSACGATVLHNTVAATDAPFSSIEWRFDETTATVANNLLTHAMRDRGGSAVLDGNLESATNAMFVDLAGGDLHLVDSAATAIDQATAGHESDAADDIDGDARTGAPDIGADEFL